jgi:type III pantothenate kinase
MQLVIDIGNTRVKAAVFNSVPASASNKSQKKEMLHFFVFKNTDELLASGVIDKYSIKNCIIGSVVNEIDGFIESLREQSDVILFDSGTAIPIKNLYKTAHTLGSDRLAAAVGANAEAPDQDILVIDAGTCVKYNFVNSNNEYLGGGISPGLQMRFKAVNTFTSRLPLLEPDENYDQLIGTNSSESILSGVQLGIINEVDSFIDQYRQRFNNIKVFLTGGDTEFLAKRLKNRIFADQNLILKGLNEILDHHLKSIK